MRLIGYDLHASQQSIAMLDRDTGVVVEKMLMHQGGTMREFYASIPPPVVVGSEAMGSMGWFLRLIEELAIECRVGHPTAIRKAETADRNTIAAMRRSCSAAARKPVLAGGRQHCGRRAVDHQSQPAGADLDLA